MLSACLPELVLYKVYIYKTWQQLYTWTIYIQEKAYEHYALAIDWSNDTKRYAQLVYF